jgi:hypothetical protein
MLKWFKLKDSDGELHDYPVDEVLAGKHDSILRFPKSYLAMVADERPWEGKPHVTDLLNGPRYVFLKATTDYATSPEGAAFRVMGIQAHKKLEGLGETSELHLENDDVIGRSDLLESNGDGTWTLTDYKVVGSYKVGLAIGIYTEREEIIGPDGTAEIFKSGDRKGQVKSHNVLKCDPSKADTKDWTRQLNIYRYLAEKECNIRVTKLQIFVIVRDGNTIAARSRGVMDETYLVPIKIFQDDKVQSFISERSQELMDAFKPGAIPRACNKEEAWDGRRCMGYCDVSKACAAMGCEWIGADIASEDGEA